ncbi:hypothetical protein AZE42_05970 [Rhizopogon vesiculosus]|uniref:Uncharacterized protein n=1 Tax=Rhizopogon vesiculosus TaxID=180088 RepID=A0A1J8QEY8_9AGAM|nr:hypothetical protein AZE42_05970 [Rhizopogon vesiculosus]
MHVIWFSRRWTSSHRLYVHCPSIRKNE